MSRTTAYVLVAGTAASLASFAMAQSSVNKDRAYGAELAADSMSRASSQGSSGGFKIADGQYSLTVGGLVQFGYTANFRSDDAGTTITDDDSFTNGFAMGKTKLWMKGSVADPNLTFKLQGDFASEGGAFTLDDAYGKYRWSDNNVWLQFGQFKQPVVREEVVGDQYQLAAQRSFVNQVFNPDRTQGILLGWDSDSWRWALGMSDGWRAKNTDFNSGAESDWSVNARVDFKWAGDWDRFDDFTSFRGQNYAGMLGAGLMYETFGSTGDATDNAVDTEGTFWLYTVDVAFEGDGWNVFGAFVGSNTDPDASGEDSTSNFGIVAQAGVFVSDNWELFGRWDGLFADEQADSGADLDPSDFHFLTLGANYYMVPGSHAAKFTADVVISLNETYALRTTDVLSGDAGTAIPGAVTTGSLPYTRGGILGDIDSGEVALQLQMQLMF